MYPPHLNLVGVGFEPHRRSVEDTFNDTVAVKWLIVELMSSVGDEDRLPNEGVENRPPALQWGVVFSQSWIYESGCYLIVVEQYFEDMRNTWARTQVGEPVMGLST